MHDLRDKDALQAQQALKIIEESKRKAIARKVLPNWFIITNAVLTGLLFISISYLGKYGLPIFILYLIPIFIHYKRSGSWPYFLTPAKDVLAEGVEEIRASPIANAILILVMILTPFIFIASQEMLIDGIYYAPVVSGIILSLIVYAGIAVSRNHYLKKYA